MSDKLGIRPVFYGSDARAARTNLMSDLAAEDLSPSFLTDLLEVHRRAGSPLEVRSQEAIPWSIR